MGKDVIVACDFASAEQTFAFLDKALIIYKKIGFYEIPKYNNNPIDNAIYMKLDL